MIEPEVLDNNVIALFLRKLQLQALFFPLGPLADDELYDAEDKSCHSEEAFPVNFFRGGSFLETCELVFIYIPEKCDGGVNRALGCIATRAAT